METIELARRIVDAVSDVKAEDIVLLDLRDVTPIADYFVICSGTSDRQLRAIIDRVRDDIQKDLNVKPWRVEGQAEGGWVLLDYGDVVVHAFSPDQRDYYDLEGFWSQARTLLRMQ